MSAQTGTAPPSGPASQRFVDRARFRVLRFEREPNPIWIRELRQATRLARTPVILCVVAILVTLLIASIGGVVSQSSSPAETGSLLYQVFFSVAWSVVTLVGPAVAANSVASEREGRTWEAVLLTGLRPGVVARGKFLAAYTAIGMYIVMLAPVGAMAFLFGGVTTTEVIAAFVFLFFLAALGVAFGLAISSKMTSLRGAIVLTLLLAFPLSLAVFFTFGVGLSYLAHDAWPAVVSGLPVWLPTAFDRAPFSLEYAVFLVALPVSAVALPVWFLYEVTIANLASAADDRSLGLKRWFVVATAVLTPAAATPLLVMDASDFAPAVVLGTSGLSVYLTFCVFLFAGEPLGPSRRVLIHWDRERAGRVRRFFGPSIVTSTELLLAGGLASLSLLALVGALAIRGAATSEMETQLSQVSLFSTYAAGFVVFLAGLGAWLRVRSPSAAQARALLFAILFGVAVGPWIVAAVTGILAAGADEALIVASPSPFFAFVMMGAVTELERAPTIFAGILSSAGYALLGVLLFLAARRRCRAIVVEQRRLAMAADRVLAEEDEAALRGASP